MAKKVSLNVVKKLAVRCSSLPLFFSCKNAIANPDKLTNVRVENGFERLGTYIHEAIQKAVETGEVNLTKIEQMFPPEEAERAKLLFMNGLKVVEEAKRDMKNPQFEVEVSFETEKFSATGHVDVLDLSPTVAYVVDFKTGRTRDDHYHQMVGYAVGAWNKVGRPDTFVAHVAYVYLESNEPTSYTFTADDLKDWIKELDSLADVYTVNRRCVYCPLNNTCPAFRDYVKGSMSFLLDVKDAPEKIARMDGKALSRLATALKTAGTATERIRDYIKATALKTGKDLDLGNGDKFTITTSKRRILLTQKALPVLAKYVTAKDIARATSLQLHSLLTAASSRAKGGMKGVLRTELENKLQAAGAILVHEQAQLRTVFAGDKKWPKKKSSKK